MTNSEHQHKFTTVSISGEFEVDKVGLTRSGQGWINEVLRQLRDCIEFKVGLTRSSDSFEIASSSLEAKFTGLLVYCKSCKSLHPNIIEYQTDMKLSLKNKAY